LTVRLTSQTKTKVGYNDPVVLCGNDHRSTNKRYAGDNRLITPKRPYRRGGLAPRCWIITSWSWSRFQGFSCSL